MATILGAVPGAGKNSWTGSNDPTNLNEMDPQIRGAVAYLTMRNQIMQYLPEALRLLAAHKRGQQQSRPAPAGYQDGMIVRNRQGMGRSEWQTLQRRRGGCECDTCWQQYGQTALRYR